MVLWVFWAAAKGGVRDKDGGMNLPPPPQSCSPRVQFSPFVGGGFDGEKHLCAATNRRQQQSRAAGSC